MKEVKLSKTILSFISLWVGLISVQVQAAGYVNEYCPIIKNERSCNMTVGCQWLPSVNKSRCEGAPGAPSYQTQYCPIYNANEKNCNQTPGCQYIRDVEIARCSSVGAVNPPNSPGNMTLIPPQASESAPAPVKNDICSIDPSAKKISCYHRQFAVPEDKNGCEVAGFSAQLVRSILMDRAERLMAINGFSAYKVLSERFTYFVTIGETSGMSYGNCAGSIEMEIR